MNEVFPARLRRLLKAKGQSRRNLALTIGLSVSSVNKYARGEREPCMYHLIKIADYLDASMDFLAGRTNEFPEWYEEKAAEAFETVKEMIDPEGFKEWMHGQVGRA